MGFYELWSPNPQVFSHFDYLLLMRTLYFPDLIPVNLISKWAIIVALDIFGFGYMFCNSRQVIGFVERFEICRNTRQLVIQNNDAINLSKVVVLKHAYFIEIFYLKMSNYTMCLARSKQESSRSNRICQNLSFSNVLGQNFWKKDLAAV